MTRWSSPTSGCPRGRVSSRWPRPAPCSRRLPPKATANSSSISSGRSSRACSTQEHALTLEPILELALQAGRIRAVYGPPGEQAALRLYRKLPRGAALQQSARDVSDALGRFAVIASKGRRSQPSGRARTHCRSRPTRAGSPSDSIARARESRPSRSERGLAPLLHGLPRPGGARRSRRRRRTGRPREGRGAAGSGAEVTVVAPRIVPELDDLDLTLIRREYRAPDLDGKFLVVAATSRGPSTDASFGTRKLGGSSATSSTCRSCAPSSCRPSTATSRSPLPSRREERRLRSPSASATRSRPWSGPSTPSSLTGCATCAPGRSRTSPPTRSARSTSPGSSRGARMTVHLVGAGPGDPELITARGLDLVRACDILVADALVAPSWSPRRRTAPSSSPVPTWSRTPSRASSSPTGPPASMWCASRAATRSCSAAAAKRPGARRGRNPVRGRPRRLVDRSGARSALIPVTHRGVSDASRSRDARDDLEQNPGLGGAPGPLLRPRPNTNGSPPLRRTTSRPAAP